MNEQFEMQYPDLIKKTWNSVLQNDMMKWPGSRYGKDLLAAASSVSQVVKEEPGVMHFMKAPIYQMVSQQGSTSSATREMQLVEGYKLRTNKVIKQQWTEFTNTLELNELTSHQLFSVFIRQLHITFTEEQLLLAKVQSAKEGKEVELKDWQKDTVGYIAGWIVMRISSKPTLYPANVLTNITGTVESKHTAWIKKQSRGGLHFPSDNFLNFLFNLECALQKADLQRLSASSLLCDKLKEDLLDQDEVKRTWEEMAITGTTVLEKIIDLYLRLRGHAVTRYMRRKQDSQRATQRAGVRKHLKQINQGPAC